MHRTDAPNNNGGLFKDRDPGLAAPGTALDDDWLNAVQEEIAYTIEQAGIVLAKGTNTQLRAAIQKMITDAAKAVSLAQPTFAAGVADGDVVYWDAGNTRFDKALADGSAKERAVGVADVSNNKVIAYGEAAVFAGLTAGTRYYLSPTVAGTLTAVRPTAPVLVGIAKSATTVFVDIDPQPLENLPPGHISGLVLSNNVTDAAHDIDVSTGAARGDADSDDLRLTAAITKQIDASWAVGTNQGGLDGTEVTIGAGVAGVPNADTWYHVWLIKRSDTGVVDVLFSESATAPTLPASYDAKRRIGAVLTDGTPAILAFTAYETAGGGLLFDWDTRTLDFTGAPPTATERFEVLSVPVGYIVRARLELSASYSANRHVLVSSPAAVDTPPGVSNCTLIGNLSDSTRANAKGEWETDTLGRVRWRVDATGGLSLHINTLGWIDHRR